MIYSIKLCLFSWFLTTLPPTNMHLNMCVCTRTHTNTYIMLIPASMPAPIMPIWNVPHASWKDWKLFLTAPLQSPSPVNSHQTHSSDTLWLVVWSKFYTAPCSTRHGLWRPLRPGASLPQWLCHLPLPFILSCLFQPQGHSFSSPNAPFLFLPQNNALAALWPQILARLTSLHRALHPNVTALLPDHPSQMTSSPLPAHFIPVLLALFS